jgi:hypothetical protein
LLRESRIRPQGLGADRASGGAGVCGLMSEVFFVSVKRLVRICACRDRVSDPRVAECTHRSAEKTRVCAWDDQGAARVVMHVWARARVWMVPVRVIWWF